LDEIGTYHEVTKNRGWGAEFLSSAAVKNRVYGLIELDVTKAREYMRGYREKTGEALSFTGWIIKCIGEAVGEDKQVQAYKRGKNRFVIFDDVDVSVAVEREVKGEKIPVPYVVRKVNEKSFMEIHHEIRAAQTQKEMTGPVLGSERTPRILSFFQSLPSFLRIIGWWKFRRDPFLKKRTMGTVGVTTVGMFGNIGGWPITIGFHSLEFALGGISKKPRVADGGTEIREFLSLTMMFDEDVIFGAPTARFAARLAELIQGGYGLIE